MTHLITHGEVKYGKDPCHTAKGIFQISKIELPTTIGIVVVGTGTRFREIFEVIKDKLLPRTFVKHSPFCGSADSREHDGSIFLADGTIVRSDSYLGLIGGNGFNPWSFVAGLPDNALLCAGGELLASLGMLRIYKEGYLYEIDSDARVGRMIN